MISSIITGPVTAGPGVQRRTAGATRTHRPASFSLLASRGPPPSTTEPLSSANISGMHEPVAMDAIDRQILALLSENARRTVRDIADRVKLTVAPVNRRIQRLERIGVITGYSARINYGRSGTVIEAVTELRFTGDLDLAQIVSFAAELPEVQEVLTVAGDPDALVRIRANGIEQLQAVVNRLRTGGSVTGTKTLVVLESWRRES